MQPMSCEDSKLEPELMVFVCGHRRDIPDDGQPYKGTVRWSAGEARLDVGRLRNAAECRLKRHEMA